MFKLEWKRRLVLIWLYNGLCQQENMDMQWYNSVEIFLSAMMISLLRNLLYIIFSSIYPFLLSELVAAQGRHILTTWAFWRAFHRHGYLPKVTLHKRAPIKSCLLDHSYLHWIHNAGRAGRAVPLKTATAAPTFLVLSDRASWERASARNRTAQAH